MRSFLIFIIGSILLFADIKQDVYNLYQNHNYKEACNIGMKNFKDYKYDEQYISLYAFSCLHSDHIDRLATPITKLKFSKEARTNAAYFSIILMQKKLLYYALVDEYDLSSFKLPTTDHVLSKAFDYYSKLGKHTPKDFYLFEDYNDKKITYKLYITKENKLSKIVIEELYNSNIIKRHMYW